MKTVLFASTLTLAASLWATAYYVDPDGSDAASGLAPESAWRTLDKVNTADLQPGDIVRFKRGGLWRGSLIPHSGEPGKPVTYTFYGTGAKPILQQSIDRSKPEDWVEEKTGLWATRPVAKPVVGRPVWMPSAADDYSYSFQSGTKGTFRRMTEGGETFHRFACTTYGEQSRSNYIQMFGPAMTNLPDKVLVRMRARASAPMRLESVHIMENGSPYNVSHKGRQSGTEMLGAAWQDVEIYLERSRMPDILRKPVFHFSIGDVLAPGNTFDFRILGAWEIQQDKANAIPCDVGIFIVNHGEKWGVKKWRNPEWDVPKTPTWQTSVTMAQELDYRYDPDQQRVFVVCDRNPGEKFASIELALTRHIVCEGGKHDVVYDGLWVRYTGAHGFGGGTTSNLVIRNCDISWIGGGLQFWRKNDKTGKIVYPVRFGNGIEFWGTCHNNLVERNRLWEIYDAALTNQGRYDDEIGVTWRDNVIWNAEYSYEYWNAQLTRNILFEHNTCVDAGSGWAHAQRPNPNGAHLMFYSNRAVTSNFVVRANVFCRATEWTARSAIDWRASLVQDYNLIWNDGSVPLFNWLAGKNLRMLDWTAYQSLGFDPHGQFAKPVFVNEAKRDYRLAPNSPGLALAPDGTPVGARNMPGLDGDQSAE